MSFWEGLDFVVSDGIQKGAVKGVGSAVGAAAAGAAAGAAAVAPGNGGPSGQGFTMSTDEMRTLLDKCKSARDDLRQQFNEAGILAQAQPPGDEPASQQAVNDQTKGVNASGQAYLAAFQKQYAYFSELVTRIEQALGITEAADQNAAGTVNSSGGELG